MQINFLENRTDETVTFRRFVLGGWDGTQVEQTHVLDLVPGYNALPDDAADVPVFYHTDRPPFTPSEKDMPYKAYFENSHIDLLADGKVLWRYSYFPNREQILRALKGEFSKITAVNIVGGHGKMTALQKISFDGAKISQAIVTEEELERITIELAGRWRPGQ